MANERYIDAAITHLRDFINTNLPAQLRAVETEQGLTASSLTDPEDVLKHRAPFDNRSPLVEIFEESWAFIDIRNKLISTDCTVALHHMGDADLEAGEIFGRRYMTAIIQCVLSDTTLGGKVVTIIPTDGASVVGRGDNATTRRVYTQGFDVHTYEGTS